MSYVKWVGNADRHNDWTTVLDDGDGNVIRMGEPIDLEASKKSALEEQGRIFEDSSAEEAKEYQAAQGGAQVGADTAVSAPVFENAGPQNQQTETTDQGDAKGDAKKK